MPEHLVVADCMEGSLVFTMGPKVVRVVQHWRVPAATSVTPALADSIFTPIRTLWVAQLAAQLASDVALQRLDLRDLRTPGMAIVSSAAAGGAGTSVSDRLPNQIALCLTIRTARAGRSFRGRNYWPGLAENASGPGGVLTAGAHTAFAAFAAGYVGAASQSGCVLVVMHRPLFAADGAITVAGSIENATSVVLRDDVLDTQRRRAQ